MAFAGLSWWAVLAAAVISYAFGAAYYMALSKPWLAAVGKTEAEIRASPSPLPFIVAFVSQLVMAIVLAGVIGHVAGTGPLSLKLGLISAALCFVGFVATTLATNHGFQDAPRTLTLIDGGHWLGVLLIQGAIIGAIGV
ncbi:MAG: DUF1761 family protein [Rhizobiales bacterium]|nr:DUF1761 family protein [Hyphomicrobiales bacterium]